jgi:hypothetical protein
MAAEPPKFHPLHRKFEGALLAPDCRTTMHFSSDTELAETLVDFCANVSLLSAEKGVY